LGGTASLFMPAFHRIDTDDISVNVTNSVVIAPAANTQPPRTMHQFNLRAA
jgi:hypothetical protein